MTKDELFATIERMQQEIDALKVEPPKEEKEEKEEVKEEEPNGDEIDELLGL